MKALLDTNAISELFKPTPNPGLWDAIAQLGTDNLCLSVIVLGELELGAGLLAPGNREKALIGWNADTEMQFSDRLLPVARDVVNRWSQLVTGRTRLGRPIAAPDSLIAATALDHGPHLVTRNTADFESAGVVLLNPWT